MRNALILAVAGLATISLIACADDPATVAPTANGAASALVIKATSGATTATANANFKVNPKLTMTIPVNSAALIAAGGGTKYVDGWAGAALGTAPAALKTQQGNPI